MLVILGAIGGLTPCRAETWTNRDGKTITASFERVDQTIGVVGLRQGETTYQVPLINLDEASRDRAIRLQGQKEVWAREQAAFEVFPEAVLLELARFDPAKFNLKSYTVKGKVSSITSTSLSSTMPAFVLEGGTECPVNLSNWGNPDELRLKVSRDQILLLVLARNTGLKQFAPYKTVISLGQTVLIHGQLHGDRIRGIGLLNDKDATNALAGGVAKSFENFTAASPAGLLTSVMPSPAPIPAPSPLESLWEWVRSMLAK
jgi:hypothetical protein